MHFISTVLTIQMPDYHQLGESCGVAGGAGKATLKGSRSYHEPCQKISRVMLLQPGSPWRRLVTMAPGVRSPFRMGVMVVKRTQDAMTISGVDLCA